MIYHVYFQKHDMPDNIKQRFGEFRKENLNAIIQSLCEKTDIQTGDKIIIEIIKDTNVQ